LKAETAVPDQTASLEPFNTVSVLHALQDHLKEAQFNAGPLIADFRVANGIVLQPFEYVQLSVVGEPLEHISEIAKDDIFGLQLGSTMEPGKSGPLGHLALSAPTARDALSVLAGYVNVFITSMECGYEENHKSGLSTAYSRSTPMRLLPVDNSTCSPLHQLFNACATRWAAIGI